MTQRKDGDTQVVDETKEVPRETEETKEEEPVEYTMAEPEELPRKLSIIYI